MGSSTKSKKSSNDLHVPVETPNRVMDDPATEDTGDVSSDDEPANGDAHGSGDSTGIFTPRRSSKSATPETPDSGDGDGEVSPPVAYVELSPPKTLIGAISDICDQIRDPLFPTDLKGPGYAYVFYDPSKDGDMYKIGRSVIPPERQNCYGRECKLDDWEMASRPYFRRGIWGHLRVEQLAHKQLGNTNFIFDCSCGKKHKEFFLGKNETALDVLDIWLRWLWQKPYDESGQLKPFWEHRLEMLEPNFLSAFTCGEDGCRSKDETAPACPACLMEGWKVWTTPPFADRAVFLAYSVPWQMVFWRAFLFVFLYVSAFSAGNVYFLSCMLEGCLALAFYPHPKLRVQQVFSELGMGPQPDDIGVKRKPNRTNSPKGKQPDAHHTSPLRRPSLSLARIRSPLSPRMNASPGSPSERAAVRRKRGGTKSASGYRPPSLKPSTQTQSSQDKAGALKSAQVDGSPVPPRRSPRLAEQTMKNAAPA